MNKVGETNEQKNMHKITEAYKSNNGYGKQSQV